MRQTKIHLFVFTYEHKTKQNTLVCPFLRAQDKPLNVVKALFHVYEGSISSSLIF